MPRGSVSASDARVHRGVGFEPEHLADADRLPAHQPFHAVQHPGHTGETHAMTFASGSSVSSNCIRLHHSRLVSNTTSPLGIPSPRWVPSLTPLGVPSLAARSPLGR